jgi:hypothetical protein
MFRDDLAFRSHTIEFHTPPLHDGRGRHPPARSRDVAQIHRRETHPAFPVFKPVFSCVPVFILCSRRSTVFDTARAAAYNAFNF